MIYIYMLVLQSAVFFFYTVLLEKKLYIRLFKHFCLLLMFANTPATVTLKLV